MLGPRKIDDMGSHKVGTIPVARRSRGPKSQRGHLRYWNCEANRFLSTESSSVSGDEASKVLLEFSFSKILGVSFRKSPAVPSVRAYVTGEGSQGEDFVQQTVLWRNVYLWFKVLHNFSFLQLLCERVIVHTVDGIWARDAIISTESEPSNFIVSSWLSASRSES